MKIEALETTPEERAKRKRYLFAALITCIAVVMVGAAMHVVKLGSIRIGEMKARATYDLSQVQARTRAAGEEISTHQLNEKRADENQPYTVAEAEALLPIEAWRELEKDVLIPAGSFRMGTSAERADQQNGPEHVVDLPAYRIDKYPVTNAQYAKFVAKTGYRSPLHWKGGRIPKGTELHPVTMVSWADAAAYAKWAGKRLPTEAEWEKAARGSDGRRWPWGNEMDPAKLNTYYRVGNTSPVTQYPSGKSPYGLFDMAGNVNQWTSTDFKPYPGSNAPAELFEPKKEEVQAYKVGDLKFKVLRGGTWRSDPFSTQTFHRNFSLPNFASDFYGFRCARDL